ncbi:hypothetical protein L9W80_13520 [Vibrio aestuarianus]|uniref:hypothetical protein n=1 Tax=Vibrio aestuarianus TaxID=28171 RepID=UPI00237C89D0|nr:hypothetical protein [Vibrio aestuarianus]MDE1351174.1 hypothetical protein [Vibrio aestuarianus]
MMVLSFIATLLLAAFIQVLIQQESHPMTSQPEQHNTMEKDDLHQRIALAKRLGLDVDKILVDFPQGYQG